MSCRTEDTFNDHMERVVGACGNQWIVLQTDTLLGSEYIITPKLCKSNYCTYCRAHNLRRLRQALYISLRKKQWRLVTLTYPDHSVDKLQQLKTTSRQFKLLVQRLRRRFPRLTFIRTIELHESDFPHLHMIVDRYIPKPLITKAWHDLGGGIVDIVAHRRCPVCGVRGKCPHNPNPKPLNYKDAADYLTDEIEKTQQDPHKLGLIYWLAHLRSVTTSRNFNITPTKNQWKFIGIWNEEEEAWNYVYDVNDYESNPRWKSLTGIVLDDAVMIGHGFKQSFAHLYNKSVP